MEDEISGKDHPFHDFYFHRPKGTSRVTLVAENRLAKYREIKYFENLTIKRDDDPVFDVHTKVFGWGMNNILAFEFIDRCVRDITEHDYKITARIYFMPDKSDQ